MVSGAGMEDVVAAESAIAWIDGKKGELRYRGYSIDELAEKCSYEQVAFLLWNGELPTGRELSGLESELNEQRVAHASLISHLGHVPKHAHPLDALRYVVARDALDNPATWNNDEGANTAKSVAFAAWFPMVVAGLHRRAMDLDPIQPRGDLNTASNFLYMLHGQEPSATAMKTLEISFVLHAEHELNASTFAARVTIATQSNLHAAVISALGTLSGPRHGGASERVIRMLEEIGTPDRVEPYVRDQLQRKQRIMGYGHRVYRTTDPRAHHLRRMTERLLEDGPHATWIEILRQLSEVMQRERNLYPNVDLYAAVVNHALGIEPAFYTSVFACSRIAGWTAHAMEQLDGRMIRPAAHYTGREPRSMREGVTA